MRGRPKKLATIANEVLVGSCLQSLEIVRVNGVSRDYVHAVKSMGITKIVKEESSLHTSDPVEVKARAVGTPVNMQNGMPFQGYIDCGAELVPFYGSPEAYRKCAA